MNEGSDEEYEEVLVYVHFPDMDAAHVKDAADGFDSMVVKDAESDQPVVEINGLDLKGQYVHNLGSQAFFRVAPTTTIETTTTSLPEPEPRNDDETGVSVPQTELVSRGDENLAAKPEVTFIGVSDVKLLASHLG